MTFPPVLYHYFKFLLPYAHTLSQDYLLLLEHRPVYTAGRRQTDESVQEDRERLTRMGADFVGTERGGQLTYHGPGQLVGYPLVDLGRTTPAMPVREYVCRLQRILQAHLRGAHGIVSAPSDNTGIFLDDGDGRGAKSKVASIGVQVRHRLTTHGFALNVTRSPLPWFDNVVACGLADVKATSIEGRSQSPSGDPVSVEGEVAGIVDTFGRIFGRDMERLELKQGEVAEAILELEDLARKRESDSPAPSQPLVNDS